MGRPRFKKGATVSPPSLTTDSGAFKDYGSNTPAGENEGANEHTAITEWVAKYSPKVSRDLAMHKLKVGEIRKALDSDPLIVISGPAGSSKSIAVRLIAAEANRKLVEWQTPAESIGGTGVVKSFWDFLAGASIHDSRDIILVDDVPNILHDETRRMFETALLSWLSRAKSAELPTLVILLTEIETTANYHEAVITPRIFGDALDHARWIKTNPVNSLLLTKVLKSVAAVNHLNGPLVAEEIEALSKCGDIRNALTCFEFWSRFPSEKFIGGRGETTGLFHAIGKIVHGSDKVGSVNAAIDDFQESRELFELTVLENYTKARKSQLTIEVAEKAAEWLSYGDLGIGDACLGVYTTLKHSSPNKLDLQVPSKFVPLAFSQHHKWRRIQRDRLAALTRFERAYRYQGHLTSSLASEIKGFDSFGLKPKIEENFLDSASDSEWDWSD